MEEQSCQSLLLWSLASDPVPVLSLEACVDGSI
jgi:hypothetical protein